MNLAEVKCRERIGVETAEEVPSRVSRGNSDSNHLRMVGKGTIHRTRPRPSRGKVLGEDGNSEKVHKTTWKATPLAQPG